MCTPSKCSHIPKIISIFPRHTLGDRPTESIQGVQLVNLHVYAVLQTTKLIAPLDRLQ